MQSELKTLLEEMRSVLCGNIRPSSQFIRTRMLKITEPLAAPKCGVCGQGAWACNEGGCHYLESGNGAPVETLAADALERLLALEPNADNLKRWQSLQAEPRPVWYIDGSPSDGWSISLNGAVDGDCPTLGDLFDHPFEAADWCERNGFAWEVQHLAEGHDPVIELTKWRAGK